MSALHAWAVRRVGDDHESIVNHTSRGRAIADSLHDWQDAWPDTKFTDMRARKVGAPITTARLRRVAEYRGTPWAHAGARVELADGRCGFIVDGNDSANFDVLLDGGCTVNCHPCDIKPLERTNAS